VAPDPEGVPPKPEPKWKAYRQLVRGIDLDGDNLDNLEEWYQEGIDGPGGMPKGFMRDLVLRSYFGTFAHPGYIIRRGDRGYTGPNGQPSETDYETALETIRSHCKEGKYVGKDDGKGWFWLAATQKPDGLVLYLKKCPPYGQRPLALIKQDNVDEFFDKVDWNRLYIRLHKWNLWSQNTTFPFKINPKYWVKKK